MKAFVQRFWARLLAEVEGWNPEEGFLDLGVGLATGLLLRFLPPAGWQARLLQSRSTGLVAGMGATFLLTLFLTRVYRAYAAHDRARGVVMVALFLAVNWAYLAPLYFTAVQPHLLAGTPDPGGDPAMMLLPVYVALSVTALILGNVSSDDASALYALQRILFVGFALAGMAALLFGAPRLAFFFLGVLLLPVLAVGWRWLVPRFPFHQPAWMRIARLVGEPITFGATLGLWQAMTVLFLAQAYAAYGLPLRASGVAWALLLGGILPLRLLANLAPPWRLIHTALGLLMSLGYLWTLGQWMQGLW